MRQVDWATIAVIAVLVLAASGSASIVSLILAGLGLYIIYTAIQQATRGQVGGGGRTTYWRGQRLDLDVPRRRGGIEFDVERVWPKLVFAAVLLLAALVPFVGQLPFQIPWLVFQLCALGIGAYFLWAGWRAWSSGGAAGPSAKYWRGQRIEPARQSFELPPLRMILPAILPLLLGVGIIAGVVIQIASDLL
ncbi:MAG TPA: hypothetical protein VFS21_23245 [Roseiflexaceae bacterium]|nr:hypothetical protein [Roseiflexaceae bacterium]